MPGVFESILIEVQLNNCNAIIGEIYRFPNTNERQSLEYYDTISKQLQDSNKCNIIGKHQNFDYINIYNHKNTEEILNVFFK